MGNHYFSSLQKSFLKIRSLLLNPKEITLDLAVAKNKETLAPNLPREVILSFYLHAGKLKFSVVHYAVVKGVPRIEKYHAECDVPWLGYVIYYVSHAITKTNDLLR